MDWTMHWCVLVCLCLFVFVCVFLPYVVRTEVPLWPGWKEPHRDCSGLGLSLFPPRFKTLQWKTTEAKMHASCVSENRFHSIAINQADFSHKIGNFSSHRNWLYEINNINPSRREKVGGGKVPATKIFISVAPANEFIHARNETLRHSFEFRSFCSEHLHDESAESWDSARVADRLVRSYIHRPGSDRSPIPINNHQQ